MSSTGETQKAPRKLKEYPEERYRRWWLGKRCRLAGRGVGQFKKVIAVKLIGPPSFVYGDVWLTFEDGTEFPVYHGDAFTPRKSDVEVEDGAPSVESGSPALPSASDNQKSCKITVMKPVTLAKRIEVKYQEHDVNTVMKYFVAGFELKPEQSITRSEWFYDANKGQVVFKLYFITTVKKQS